MKNNQRSIKFIIISVLTIFLLVIISIIPGGSWSLIQIFRSIFGRRLLTNSFNSLEEEIWNKWEINNLTLKENEYILKIPTITSLNEISNVNLARPFIIKNLSNHDMLTLSHLTSSPMSELTIDYFIDARRKNTVPDSRGKVGDIINKIIQGGPEKIGTQMIVEHFPDIVVQFVDQNPWLRNIFGDQRVEEWRKLSSIVTFPIFISRGRENSITQKLSTIETSSGTTRTDLHCEPISNVVVQTVGSKKWTLVEPEYSYLLKPTISPDGRAYFYSSLDPFNPNSLKNIPHYEVITEEGDIIYVPTWTWHRVDYNPNIIAVSLSIFQFIATDFIHNNPLYAITLIPNLIKEAIGLKMQ